MQEKEQIAQQFHCTDRQVIVAINAFGLEIDKLDIQAVVHVEPIY